MLKRRSVLRALTVSLMALGAGLAQGQDYPSKPVHIITGGVGGGTDFASRLIASGLTTSLRQQVIVENRGGGTVHGDVVSKSPPDGYTLLLHASNIWLAPFLRDNVPYDPLRDLAPITMTTRAPNILVVHPSLPVKTVKELIALAKSSRDGLNYSSGSTGGSTHLAGELFNVMAHVKLVRVVYKNDASEAADLLSGQVHMTFGAPSVQLPHIRSGRLRAVAVTGLERSPLFPNLPTIAASGLPGYESVSLQGMFAPGKTPTAVISRLNQEVTRVISQPDIKEKFLNAGVEPVGSSAEQFATIVKSEMVKWGKLIKDAGIREN